MEEKIESDKKHATLADSNTRWRAVNEAGNEYLLKISSARSRNATYAK